MPRSSSTAATRTPFLWLIVLLVLTAPAFAAKPRPKLDVDALMQAAEAGKPYAQLDLGIAYDRGLGVDHDYDQARYWYRLAAEQGVPEAQFNIGQMLLGDKRHPADYMMAADWLQKASRQGLPEAMFLLGVLYAEGKGVEQDDHSAVQWLSKAADGGDKQAAAYLQRHYPGRAQKENKPE